jgi:two-component system, OmpR family, sensor kinase
MAMAIQRGWRLEGGARSARFPRRFADAICAWVSAFLHRLSVRRKILAALAVLVGLAGAEIIINLRAMESAAFLLKRAELSYQQLSAYQQLAVGALEYIVAVRSGSEEPDESKSSRRTIEQRLASLQALTAYEAHVLQAHGEDETNSVERERLEQIGVALQSIFSAGPEPHPAPDANVSAASIYQHRLAPLLAEAVGREQEEVAGGQSAMRSMRERLRWLGAMAMTTEVAVLGFTLFLMNRSVLNPLSRLVSDVKQYGRGKLAHRVAVQHHDEFALLGRHINRMARHLERGRQDLLATKAGLEATVADRTRSLRDKNDELHQIDESRRSFFAEVSHELRTPLTAIVGEAEVTLRINSREIDSYRESLFSILANSTFLKRRIDDLMALARSLEGGIGLQKETIDLNLVVSEAVVEIRGLAKVNDVLLRFEARDSPLLVAGDESRLRQCVLILLDNAVKFSPPSRAVEIMLGDLGASAELSVIDEGGGITVDETERVFERYYQTERGRRKGGFGLGLSIARRIVEAHDGSIIASNRAHGGAKVTLMLPTARSTTV